MEKLIYKNPVLQFDFSDPDAIRVNDDFFMIASSFNHTPGIPILHSKNLVEWELVNYVFDSLPFAKFNKVRHGEGAWAPAIRYHNGYFYAIIPFVDEGVYVSKTKDPYGKWSTPECLIKGAGIIDPCPIWVEDRCYLVVGFAKSRIGFNSRLGLYEVSPNLDNQISESYTIIYDGADNNPTIEGPKFNYRNGYYYIMAPAGSVKGGWQVALRSKNIYGPYESKVVLMQNGTKINGPHQGALIDIDDADHWAFIHFQDMWAYGRIIHLEPVTWANDWPLCGQVADLNLAGAPVEGGLYPIQKKTGYLVTYEDTFKGDKLSLMWQTPANKVKGAYELNNGLVLNCISGENTNLDLLPQRLMTKVPALEFDVRVKCELNLVTSDDEVGFTIMGASYSYVSIKRIASKCYLRIISGEMDGCEHELLCEEYTSNSISILVKMRNSDIYTLSYEYYINGRKKPLKFIATAGKWIGTTYGIFARGNSNGGFGRFKSFRVKIIK